MSKSTISKVFNDRVKYMLLNAVEVASKGVVIPSVYFRSRVRLFDSMHSIHSSAQRSSQNPKYLYVIPYARYYTLRQMLIDRGDEVEIDEDDFVIREKFREMMTKHHASKQSMENEFFGYIRELKSDPVYLLYCDLDQKMKTKDGFDEDEKIRFVEITSETDIFIAEKLSNDVALYISRKEKLLKLLKDCSFVNGWITAAGVAIVVVVSPFVKTFL